MAHLVTMVAMPILLLSAIMLPMSLGAAWVLLLTRPGVAGGHDDAPLRASETLPLATHGLSRRSGSRRRTSAR